MMSAPAAAAAATAKPAAPGFFALTLINLRKDMRLEWRSKDSLNATGFFALLVLVVFSFAFEPSAEESRVIAGGIIWVSTLFATVIALNQSWAREMRNQVVDAYLASSAYPAALFLAKALGNFIFVIAIEAVLAPLFIVFYRLRVLGDGMQLALVLMLGTWALVVNGTFFAALSLRTRNRELMLPLLLIPISLPALIAMVGATTAILTGEASPMMWIRLIAGYDVIFTVAGLMMFEVVARTE